MDQETSSTGDRGDARAETGNVCPIIPLEGVNLSDVVQHGLEPTKITSFPQFGRIGDKKRASLLPLLPNFVWDGSDQGSNGNEDQTYSAELLSQQRSTPLHIRKSFWMPDKLCRVCYECEAPFSMFRRRHHCRICGQVFCHWCSNYDVGKEAFGATGYYIRVCKQCFIQQQAQAHSWSAARIHSKQAYMQVTPKLNGLQQTEIASNRHSSLSDSERLSPFKDVMYSYRQRMGSIEGDWDVESEDSFVTAHSQSPPSLSNSQSHRNTPRHSTTEFSQASLDQDSLAQAATSTGNGLEHEAQSHPTISNAPPNFSTTSSIESLQMELLRELSTITEKRAVARRHRQDLESAAIAHLENVVRHVMDITPVSNGDFLDSDRKEEWSRVVVGLVQQVVSTVDPDLKAGDQMDIRPYVKIKTIPGGSIDECLYVDGIVFRKNTIHKDMEREVEQPRVLLLSGGIEFQRDEKRLSSFETLLEQEERHTEILVGKIVSSRPDVILVGKSVSRYAQELLLKKGVVVMQHIKPKLLQKIARLVGARILSSVADVVNTGMEFADQGLVRLEESLGTCRSFRIHCYDSESLELQTKSATCVKPRQATATTLKTGEKGFEEDIKEGETFDELQAWMGKRWLPPAFRQTRGNGTISYACLDGCPGNLGCTVILRGGCQSELKTVKRAAAFCVNVAYNLRLEVSYLSNRCATLPYAFLDSIYSDGETKDIKSRDNLNASSFEEELKNNDAATSSPPPNRLPCHLLSSSLCINFGDPPAGARTGGAIRPATPYGHQGLNVTSLWMTSKTQCCQYEVKTINYYYTQQDVSLGQFLQESCFNSKLKCHNVTCKRSVCDHILSLVHGTGRIDISVGIFPTDLNQCIISNEGGLMKDEEGVVEGGMDVELASKLSGGGGGGLKLNVEDEGGGVGNVKTNQRVSAAQRGVESGHLKMGGESPIFMWSFCQLCEHLVTPMVTMSSDTWKFSFGKFLEVTYYNFSAIGRTGGCGHPIQNHVLFFACQRSFARFSHTHITSYEICIPRAGLFGARASVELSSTICSLASESAELLWALHRSITEQAEAASSPLLAGLPMRMEVIQEVSYLLAEVRAMACELATAVSHGPFVQDAIRSLAARMDMDISRSSVKDGGGATISFTSVEDDKGKDGGAENTRQKEVVEFIKQQPQYQYLKQHGLEEVKMEKQQLALPDDNCVDNNAEVIVPTNPRGKNNIGVEAARGDNTSPKPLDSTLSSALPTTCIRLVRSLMHFRHRLYWEAMNWNDRLFASGELLNVIQDVANRIKEGKQEGDENENLYSALKKLHEVQSVSHTATGKSENTAVQSHRLRSLMIEGLECITMYPAVQVFLNFSFVAGTTEDQPLLIEKKVIAPDVCSPPSLTGKSNQVTPPPVISINESSFVHLGNRQSPTGADEAAIMNHQQQPATTTAGIGEIARSPPCPQPDDGGVFSTLHTTNSPCSHSDASIGAAAEEGEKDLSHPERLPVVRSHPRHIIQRKFGRSTSCSPKLVPSCRDIPPIETEDFSMEVRESTVAATGAGDDTQRVLHVVNNQVVPEDKSRSLPGSPWSKRHKDISSSSYHKGTSKMFWGEQSNELYKPKSSSQLPVTSLSSHPVAPHKNSRQQLLSLSPAQSAGIKRESDTAAKPSSGGRSKLQSALARFLLGGESCAEGGRDWRVHVSNLEMGRPRLEKSRTGEFIPVYTDQPSSVIAYSLASASYSAQTQRFLKAPPDYGDATQSGGGVGGLSLNLDSDLIDIYGHVPIVSPPPAVGLEKGQKQFNRTPSNTSMSGFAVGVESVGSDNDGVVEHSSHGVPLVIGGGSPPLSDIEEQQAPHTSLGGTNTNEEETYWVLNTQQQSDGGKPGVAPVTEEPLPLSPVWSNTRHPVRDLHSSPRQKSPLELQLRSHVKSHIKHKFSDLGVKDNSDCKFFCHIYWATQFEALRLAYFNPVDPTTGRGKLSAEEAEDSFMRSLSMATKWETRGGKSGATFSKTADTRFVMKNISKTELQMFLDFAPHYFSYLAQALFHNLPTVLCKVRNNLSRILFFFAAIHFFHGLFELNVNDYFFLLLIIPVTYSLGVWCVPSWLPRPFNWKTIC